tara:strand:+ start:329 stop:886 length:558 start_codon:yes stop_codon:yes gene_type:complete
MENCRVIYYDLETTGLSNNDRIIEIAGKDNNNIVFNKLINPDMEISDFISNLTGITNKKVKYRNTLERSKKIINDYFDFGNKNVYLISHNGDNFDLRFLNQHFDIKCRHIDNLKFFKKLLKQPYNSLKYLCNLFKINTNNHHHAYDDVVMLESLFLKGVELFKIKYNLEDVNMDMIYNYIYDESF